MVNRLLSSMTLNTGENIKNIIRFLYIIQMVRRKYNVQYLATRERLSAVF